MPHNNQKKAAVISDFSGFGRCSIAVALPILSAMGVQCCALPTSIFSNHTGFPSFFYTDFTQHMAQYMDEWAKLGLRFNAITTGFLGSTEQIELVKRFFQEFKDENTTAIVDPVMGDYGKLYPTFSPELAQRMRELAEFADILTPNLTEACILIGREYNENADEGELSAICRSLHDMGAKKIVISGLDRGDFFGNFVSVCGEGEDFIWEKKTGPCRSGTGDVFSSIITGDAVNGVNFADSVRRASGFVAKAIAVSQKMGIPSTDGIAFEEILGELIKK